MESKETNQNHEKRSFYKGVVQTRIKNQTRIKDEMKYKNNIMLFQFFKDKI